MEKENTKLNQIVTWKQIPPKIMKSNTIKEGNNKIMRISMEKTSNQGQPSEKLSTLSRKHRLCSLNHLQDEQYGAQ